MKSCTSFRIPAHSSGPQPDWFRPAYPNPVSSWGPPQYRPPRPPMLGESYHVSPYAGFRPVSHVPHAYHSGSRYSPNQSIQRSRPSEKLSPKPTEDVKPAVQTLQISILKNPEKETEQQRASTAEKIPDVVETPPSNNPSGILVAQGKTPMCYINELARFNKIQHQYHLTDETGPAHSKTFTVTLRLGDKDDASNDNVEEYVAKGASIKKAQHAAALMALEQTKYKKPEPKSEKKPVAVNPSVELNSLAMKLGETVQFSVLAPGRPMPRYQQYQPTSVVLHVAKKEYIGHGVTPQAAKHNAAGKALVDLREALQKSQQVKSESAVNGENDQVLEEKFKELMDIKSPISMLHESAVKSNFNVEFSVIAESGPPHLRKFVTRCTVSATGPNDDAKLGALAEPLFVEAEGSGKKAAKKEAAEKMLKELIRVNTEIIKSAETECALKAKQQGKPKPAKKKKLNIIKVQAANVEYGDGINPISRLIQIQQSKKEKEPVYTFLYEKGMPRKREFTMQVTCGEHTCKGVGNNKKMAKRAAAEALLIAMGYVKPTPQPDKPAIKKTREEEEERAQRSRKVTFDPKTKAPNEDQPRRIPPKTRTVEPNLLYITSDTAKEKRSKTELSYLADVIKFAFTFTDFPQKTGETDGFVSILNLPSWNSVDGSKGMFHGTGATLEDAHEHAAQQALAALEKFGLAAICSKGSSVRMPQEFHVLRCATCAAFQVQQVKKVNRWECRLCGAKQSVIKEYGRGSASDCRVHSQKLNAERGRVEAQERELKRLSESEIEPQNVVQETPPRGVSKWAKYLSEQADECLQPTVWSANSSATEIPAKICGNPGIDANNPRVGGKNITRVTIQNSPPSTECRSRRPGTFWDCANQGYGFSGGNDEVVAVNQPTTWSTASRASEAQHLLNNASETRSFKTNVVSNESDYMNSKFKTAEVVGSGETEDACGNVVVHDLSSLCGEDDELESLF